MLYLNVAARPQRRHETFPASARRYSCCSGSSDNCRTATLARVDAGAVPKGDVGQFGAERAHSALMRDTAERNDGAQFFHLGDRRRQKIAAGSYFFRSRLVFGRHAAHRIGDPAVDQFKSIVGTCAVFTARKAELVKRLVKQDAGIVAGERTAGPIGALQAGREADDQQTRIEADRTRGPAR